MKRRQILGAVDPDFIHHGEYTRQLPIRNASGAKYIGLEIAVWKGKPIYYTLWKVRSAEDPAGISYSVKVALAKLGDNVKVRPPMLLRDATTDAIGTGDALVSCECPAFLYWGYKYICHKHMVLFRDRETRPPKVRNPALKGIICKHLALVLTVLPMNVMSIVSDLKKRELAKPKEPDMAVAKEPAKKMTLKKAPEKQPAKVMALKKKK